VALDLGELRELLTAINQTDIAELTLKSDDFELTIRRGVQSEAVAPAPVVQLAPAAISPAIAAPSETKAPEPAAPASPPSNDRKYVEVLSPIVGTFYQSPAPDEPAFAQVGQRIRQGQTVCIIEAMKVMNEIESEYSGEVIEILVQNASPVEFGQPLMRLSPV
jgi:acetyl-CoA carboxylase biotin carboxyl carrier protein